MDERRHRDPPPRAAGEEPDSQAGSAGCLGLAALLLGILIVLATCAVVAALFVRWLASILS